MTTARQKIIDALIGKAPDNFHRSFGHFMSIFSDIEARTQETLRHFAGVTQPVAKAIFSGTKADSAIGLIKRIGEATGWPPARLAEWKDITTQFGHLNFLRNQLVHHGALWHDADIWIVTNQLVAHMPEKATRIPVSPTILADAIADLEKLDCHIFAFAWPEQYKRHRDTLDHVLHCAWRYKPPPQGRHQQKTRDKGP